MTRNRAVASGPLGLEWAVEPKPVWAETPKPNPKHPLYIYLTFPTSLISPHLLHQHTSLIFPQQETPHNNTTLLPFSVQARISDKDSVKLGSLGHFIFSHSLLFVFGSPFFITGRGDQRD
ncbi:hypothetical protein HanPI659440_Chr05g0190491 [Helianthus annuus]|nr:hypothetical protein HanPI659440_Chr05g0190491 [Helianthus annuus]